MVVIQTRSTGRLIRWVIFWWIVSLAVIVATRISPRVQQWTAQGQMLVYPLRAAINASIQHWQAFRTGFADRQRLAAANTALSRRVLQLQTNVIALKQQVAQTQALRALLHATEHIAWPGQLAERLAVSEGAEAYWRIEPGQRHGVRIGQAVVDALGLVGQVVSTGPWTSRVMLITNPKAAIPVFNVRTGAQAIAVPDPRHPHQLRLIDGSQRDASLIKPNTSSGLSAPTVSNVINESNPSTDSNRLTVLNASSGTREASVSSEPSASSESSALTVSIDPTNRLGDRWVCSGLGGHYPRGYPVGEVVSIQPTVRLKLLAQWQPQYQQPLFLIDTSRTPHE